MKIYYLLNEEGRKDCLLKGGNGKEIQFIETTINEDNIKYATVSSDGIAEIYVGFKLGYCHVESIDYCYEELEDELGKYIQAVRKITFFSKVMLADELIRWEKERMTKLREIERKYEIIMQEREIKIQERRKIKEIEKKIEDERNNREREEKIKLHDEERKKKIQEYKDERNSWINEHGNQYLKDANVLKYDIDEVYMIERAKIEFPGYQIDINKNACWSNIKNPSEKAIKEVKKLIERKLHAFIVELNEPVEEDCEFEDCEAIVIRNFFENIDMIKIL